MFRIRSVTPADLDILTDIEAQSFPEAEKATRESFEKRLAVFSDHFLILEDAGRPVGLIDGMVTDQRTITDDLYEDATKHNPKGRYQSVFGLAVIPEYRRRGCGTMLLRAFVEYARGQGREGVIVTCKEHLIDFYGASGFRKVGLSASVHGGARWYDMELIF